MVYLFLHRCNIDVSLFAKDSRDRISLHKGVFVSRVSFDGGCNVLVPDPNPGLVINYRNMFFCFGREFCFQPGTLLIPESFI